MTEIAHDSDCAVHNEPAYPNGPCDCQDPRRPYLHKNLEPNAAALTPREEAADWQAGPTREPTTTMMDALLYHSSADTEYADAHAMWVNAHDAWFRDGPNVAALTDKAPSAPAGEGGDSPITAAIRAKLAKVKATTYQPGTPAESMKAGKLDGLNAAIAIAMVEDERALRARTSEPSVIGLNRDQIAKIIDPEAFVPMEDVIGMRKAYVKADAILAGASS